MSLIACLLASDHDRLIPAILDILFLGLLGASVEGGLGRPRFCALCLFGGALMLAARALFAGDSQAPLLFGAWGATAAVLAAYLVLFPRGRVVTLVLVPFFVTIVEVPAALLLGLWLAAQLYLGAAQ